MNLYDLIHEHYYCTVFAVITIGGYAMNKLVTIICEPKKKRS